MLTFALMDIIVVAASVPSSARRKTDVAPVGISDLEVAKELFFISKLHHEVVSFFLKEIFHPKLTKMWQKRHMSHMRFMHLQG